MQIWRYRSVDPGKATQADGKEFTKRRSRSLLLALAGIFGFAAVGSVLTVVVGPTVRASFFWQWGMVILLLAVVAGAALFLVVSTWKAEALRKVFVWERGQLYLFDYGDPALQQFAAANGADPHKATAGIPQTTLAGTLAGGVRMGGWIAELDRIDVFRRLFMQRELTRADLEEAYAVLREIGQAPEWLAELGRRGVRYEFYQRKERAQFFRELYALQEAAQTGNAVPEQGPSGVLYQLYLQDGLSRIGQEIISVKNIKKNPFGYYYVTFRARTKMGRLKNGFVRIPKDFEDVQGLLTVFERLQ